MSEQEEEEVSAVQSHVKVAGPGSPQSERPLSPSPHAPGSHSRAGSNGFSISAGPSRNSPNNMNSASAQSDVLSKLPPQILHSMRESFSVLDSNSTGTINAASVLETMQSLGLQERNMSQFFPPGQPQQLSLPQYLNQLANMLVNVSPPQELLNALAAFDDDDSGQVDVAELREALLNTAPDPGERVLTERDIEKAMEGFTGRRILGKHAVGIAGVRGLDGRSSKKHGDVFRYQEFVGNLTGGSRPDQQSVSAR